VRHFGATVFVLRGYGVALAFLGLRFLASVTSLFTGGAQNALPPRHFLPCACRKPASMSIRIETRGRLIDLLLHLRSTRPLGGDATCGVVEHGFGERLVPASRPNGYFEFAHILIEKASPAVAATRHHHSRCESFVRAPTPHHLPRSSHSLFLERTGDGRYPP